MRDTGYRGIAEKGGERKMNKDKKDSAPALQLLNGTKSEQAQVEDFKDMARLLRNLFCAYRDAGFDASEALTLCCTVLESSFKVGK